MPKRIAKETKQRAVRLVLDHLDEYPNLTVACQSVAGQLGFGAESLRRWVRQAQVDAGERHGVSSSESERIRALQRDNRELREANAIVIDALLATGATPEGMYGRRTMVSHLRRQGVAASARQVDPLMRDLGMNGLVRGKGVRTTIADRNAQRAPDLLERDFTAEAPNRRWVADFTYVRTWAGFAYVSFVIDCYSRAIVGWHASMTKTTPLVTTALRMGLWRRDRAGHPAVDGLVHHSDAGSQFTSVSFAKTLAPEGIAASIGSIGDAYDNALAQTTIGLFKNEAICDDSPFRDGPLKRLEDIEWITMA